VSDARPEGAPSVAELFRRFTQVGASGFGGVMPFARRMLVEERRWLSSEEFSEALSVCQILPGPNIVNMAVFVGTRFRGARGAIAGFLGLLCAPFAIILVLGALVTQYGELPAVAAAFRGISASAAGLIVALGLKMALSPRLRSSMALFAVAAFVGIALARLPLGAFLLFAAPASVAAAAWRNQ
jgi:chromate transporter